MAVTQTDILNKALTLVGASPVISIDDASENARALSRVYDTALKYVLSECKWNFATKRANLSVVVNTLDFNFIGETTVFQKPTDMIRIFDVYPQRTVWREEGDYIIADSDTLGLLYVYFHETPSKYPGYFLEAFIDKLAADIAFQIVNSASLAEKYIKKYEDVSLMKAVTANSQTGFQQAPIDDAWDRSRYSNSNPEA